MWEYYIDEARITKAISTRMHFRKSNYAATNLLVSLGYRKENIKIYKFEDLIFSSGAIDETYTTEEIRFCEKVGDIFVSLGRDVFDFFLIDIDGDAQYDAFYIGSVIKIINKAFKGRNIIIFQCGEALLFGSGYISKVVGRDYHFTYWISDIKKIGSFSSYNLCRKNQSYSYALYMAMVTQMSLFKHRYWEDEHKGNGLELDGNFVTLSKDLSYIVSNQMDSFDLLDKALQASEFIKTDKKMSEYKDDYYDDGQELLDDEDILLKYLKE